MADKQSVTVVIFGASGDLTNRKLIPALYSAYTKDRLPNAFNIVGVSLSGFTHEGFRAKVEQGVKEFAPKAYQTDSWNAFAEHIWYQSGNATEVASYKELDVF